MKRVSFKIAKAIKDAGYPQDIIKQDISYDYNANLCNSYNANGSILYARPTYIEVWLWLWREKNINIDLKDGYIYVNGDFLASLNVNDPEEAIEQAIEHLANNNLIK